MRISDWSSDVCSSDLRQRGQAPGHGRRLEPPRLAIVNIGDKPRFVGGQADPAALGREARVAIEIDRERLDAGGRPRLDALLEVEFDQAGAFACQLLKQLDELDRAILRGARPPLGQRRLAGRSAEHTSELQALMRISYAVFCLKKKKKNKHI